MTGPGNILLITADQWRADCLSALGHPAVKTPNIDALAADGVLFERHYCQAAPCSPARASLYTGLYQMNHRVCRNGTPLDARFTNIALEGRRAGYGPALFGYTDQSFDPRALAAGDPRLTTYEEVLPGFERIERFDEQAADWLQWLEGAGEDVSDGLAGVYGSVSKPFTRADLTPRFKAEHTETGFITESFLDFLGRQEADTPWFAHLSFIRPHPPFSVPEPYNSMVPDELVELPVRAASPDAEGEIHPFVRYVLEQVKSKSFVPGGGERPVIDWSDDEIRALMAVYYGMIAEVDAQLGRLIEGLKRNGAYENTLIVLTSDHGEMMGEHHLFGKLGYFEGSYHIPLIVRAPGAGVARGTRVTKFTESIDIAPTLAEWSGIDVPLQYDGRSLLPFLRGEAPADWRDAAHWEFDFREVVSGKPEGALGLKLDQCQLAVHRGERFKYVHFAALPPLLFDLEADPGELVNLSGNPDYAAEELAAARSMLSWRQAMSERTLTGIEITSGGPVARPFADRY
ncbi:alkaline phosphatase family protein [Nisaea acidiphila]|uniref:Alkaline phosphatase family protein n=1 Tax=Nisaea acidiphila TaxID=1862145 RepID=A0A9J7AQU6_9PROT|nr:alkaline phosphatase family protein [Nisaea acidiphila]UUX49550.1 alkaline phosphatase family protein [Nisaea acidiphila]